MKRNYSIDILKLVSIFFIVIIHCPYGSQFGFAIDATARFAVPIFFMITGFYVVQPDNMSLKIKRQVLKLTKYYVVYEVIYTLYYFIIAFTQNNLKAFQYDLSINLEHIFISPILGYQLWYVVNTIWVLIIIYIFQHFNKLKLLFICSTILHLGSIIVSNLSVQLFYKSLPIDATRNFLFFGLFYILLGSYLRKADMSKIKFSNLTILAFSIFMCYMQVFERFLWRMSANSHCKEFYITTIIASVSIFVFTLRCNVDNVIIKKISSYSMPIYFLHILVISLLGLISSNIFHVNIDSIKGTIEGNTLFILAVCLASCVLYDISDKLLISPLIRLIKPVNATPL